MSYVFDIGGETIWSPANGVAQFYLATVGAAARYVDMPTGLTDLAGNWFAIEPDPFRDFVARLLSVYAAPGRGDVHAMLHGPLVVSLNLMRLAKIPLDGQTDDEVRTLTEIRAGLPL